MSASLLAGGIDDTIAVAYESREYGKALRQIMGFADHINQYFDASEALGAG